MSYSNRQAVLCLGGGGARGLAHLGAVEAVQSAGITIERVVGVSIGSLVGAMCALNNDVADARARFLAYLESPECRRRQRILLATASPLEECSTPGLSRWREQIRRYLQKGRQLRQLFRQRSLMPGTMMSDVIDALLPDIDIGETRIPLSIVALDLLSGRRVTMEKGSLKTAVLASTAIPGVLPPVAVDGMLLCDIGFIDAIPVQMGMARAKDLTIAVDVGAELRNASHCRTAAELFLRLSHLSEHLVRDYTRNLADLVISPDVSRTPWFDFTHARGLIDAGRAAAVLALCSAERQSTSKVPPTPEFRRTGLRMAADAGANF